MKKLLFAAMCFAAMGHVVAQAQESPANTRTSNVQITAAKPAKADKKTETKAKAADRKPFTVAMTDRGQVQSTPGVDPVKTSSVATVKPNLTVKERKSGPKVASRADAAPKGAYGAIIARYAATYGVPVSLAHAVIRVESNYRVNARGSAGEVGLMQIKPSTARGLGYSGSIAGLFNPETNIKFGMKYLGMAHRLGGGSTCGTILKYNAGHGAKRMNPVSANYCAKVKRHLAS